MVRSASSCNTIAKLRTMFAAHGLPDLVVSDNGTAFTSAEFRSFQSRNGIRHVTSAPNHLASNGLAERYVQTFKNAIRKSGTPDLEQELSHFLFRYQSTPHTTTISSPAQLLMGRRLKTHLDFLRPNLAAQVEKSQYRQKQNHDHSSHERHFTIGDQVFVAASRQLDLNGLLQLWHALEDLFPMMLCWQMEGLFIATLTTFRLELYQQFHPSLRNHRYLCPYLRGTCW